MSPAGITESADCTASLNARRSPRTPLLGLRLPLPASASVGYLSACLSVCLSVCLSASRSFPTPAAPAAPLARPAVPRRHCCPHAARNEPRRQVPDDVTGHVTRRAPSDNGIITCCEVMSTSMKCTSVSTLSTSTDMVFSHSASITTIDIYKP